MSMFTLKGLKYKPNLYVEPLKNTLQCYVKLLSKANMYLKLAKLKFRHS